MNKDEFCKLTDLKYETLQESDWETISMVYTWHPMISDTNGKAEIADLYDRGGMGLMEDMRETASELCGLYGAIQCADVEMELASKTHKQEMTDLKTEYLNETHRLNLERSAAAKKAQKIEEKYTS